LLLLLLLFLLLDFLCPYNCFSYNFLCLLLFILDINILGGSLLSRGWLPLLLELLCILPSLFN
jgi:hypothetical protein